MNCFWCFSEKPDNPKMGLLPDGSTNAEYAPCTDCEIMMTRGTVVIEIHHETMVEGQKGLRLSEERVVYPTGLWAIASEAWIRALPDENFQETLFGYGFCFVEPQIWDLMGLRRPQEARAT